MNLFTPPTDDYQKVKIPKGGHSGWPYWVSYHKRKILTVEHIFTDSCRYEQKPPNHTDWEKLIGESFRWWTNHWNSVMVSYRYNKDDDKIHLGVYCHIDGAVNKFMHPGKVGLGLPPEESVIFAKAPINYPVITKFKKLPNDQMEVNIILNNIDNKVIVPFKIRINRKTRVINPYIGKGGREALQDTYIARKLITNI